MPDTLPSRAGAGERYITALGLMTFRTEPRRTVMAHAAELAAMYRAGRRDEVCHFCAVSTQALTAAVALDLHRLFGAEVMEAFCDDLITHIHGDRDA